MFFFLTYLIKLLGSMVLMAVVYTVQSLGVDKVDPFPIEPIFYKTKKLILGNGIYLTIFIFAAPFITSYCVDKYYVAHKLYENFVEDMFESKKRFDMQRDFVTYCNNDLVFSVQELDESKLSFMLDISKTISKCFIAYFAYSKDTISSLKFDLLLTRLLLLSFCLVVVVRIILNYYG